MLLVGLVTFYYITIFSVLGHSILIMINFTLELYRESEECKREYKPQLKTGAEVSKMWWRLVGLAFNGEGFLFCFCFNKTLQCQIIDNCLQRKIIVIRHMPHADVGTIQ